MQIYSAIAHADVAAVQECLGRISNVDCPDDWDREKDPAERCGNWSPLMSALYLDPSAEKVAIVKVLLNAGASLNVAYPNGQTPLSLVCRFPDSECLDVLLGAGVDPHETSEAESLLELAVASHDVNVAERLFQAGVALPADPLQLRVLLLKASNCRPMLEWLFNRGLSAQQVAPFSETDDERILDAAISCGNRDQLEYLVSKGISPADARWGALPRAMLVGTEEDFVNYLERAKAAPDWLEYLEGCCECAAKRDLVGKLRLLRQKIHQLTGTLPSATNHIHTAAHNNAVECLIYLLTEGADVNAAAGLGNTPLMDACSNGCLTPVEILLEAGANVHAQNEHHDTAVNTLSTFGVGGADFLPILKLLTKHGADLNKMDRVTPTVVAEVAGGQRHEVLRWLVAQGVELNLRCFEGTALRRAVINDDLESMEILLSAGADPNVRLEDDETVLFDAKSRESVRLLLKYGADPSLKDDLFDHTAAEAIRDPMILEAFGL